MKIKMTSNAGIFDKMGNPWLSQREQFRDYGRHPAFENAEIDALALRHGLAPDATFLRASERKKETQASLTANKNVTVGPSRKSVIAPLSLRILNARLEVKARYRNKVMVK